MERINFPLWFCHGRGTRMQKNINGLFIFIFSSLLMVSCGKRIKFVTDLTVTPKVDQSDVWIKTSAKLNVGNITLPNVVLPIIVPGINRNVGEVEIISNTDNDFLNINVNLSEITQLRANQSTLPNGKSLPLIGENDVIRLNLGKKKNTFLYLSMNDRQLLMGVAISLKGMDFLGRTVGESALFPKFNIKKVIGAAGVYSSKEKSANGIGLFADLSQVLPQKIFRQRHTQALEVIDYSEVMPSEEKEQRINREIFRMHRQKVILKN